MKLRNLLPAGLLLCLPACENSSVPAEQGLKPRLVVLTDIGPAEVEPDDNESAVRLMAYADRFEIEAICTTTGWNCDPYPPEWASYLFDVIDAYEKDLPNLMKRSSQSDFLPMEDENGHQSLGYWPSADYIRNRAVPGSSRAGIGVIGEGNDSPGSDLLIRLADEDDDRPIWVCAWGGANTLSQAIWRVSQERSEEELKAFLNKFRLYTITDQDMVYGMREDRSYSSHQWLRREFSKDLMLVWDESAWLNQNALGKSDWDRYAEFIQGHGALGEVYPHYLWGVEGDTPSFLNVMPNGLNDPNDPAQVGWGGVHEFGISPDGETYAWTNWDEPLKSISNEYEQKFYPDEFNDFAARMAWAASGVGNHNPVIVINGTAGPESVVLSSDSGLRLCIDASSSYDPDGDGLMFSWWIQKSSSPCSLPEITGGETPCATLEIPASYSGKTIHLVCEVHDDGDFNLVTYRRIIITVN